MENVEKEIRLSNRVVLVPSVLLSENELNTCRKNKIKITHTSALNCDVYHIPDNKLETILSAESSGGNRALALRIVSKALGLKPRSVDGKMAMLAVASGLATFAPSEADRIVRAV